MFHLIYLDIRVILGKICKVNLYFEEFCLFLYLKLSDFVVNMPTSPKLSQSNQFSLYLPLILELFLPKATNIQPAASFYTKQARIRNYCMRKVRKLK